MSAPRPGGRGARAPTTFLAIATLALAFGCRAPGEQGDSAERPLSSGELARVEVIEGGASPWLPSHFSATLRNDSALALTTVAFEIDGRRFERSARIEPGKEVTVRLQFLFPEDEGYGEADRPEIEWRLVGASGTERP